MSEHVNEQLSALADDELPGEEMPLLLRRLGRDPELVDRLGRYYTARAAVHGDLGAAADGGFADRVAAALEAEPVLDPAEGQPAVSPTPAVYRRRLLRFARPVAGAAIAASVAVLAVGLWPTGPAERGNGPAAVTASVPSAGVGSGLAQRVAVDQGPAASAVDESVERVTWQALDPAVQRRLNGYLVNHSGNAASAGAGGMLNYARIAGHARAD